MARHLSRPLSIYLASPFRDEGLIIEPLRSILLGTKERMRLDARSMAISCRDR